MFERFTERARKVFALANQEAQHFNHEYIGSEHVLLGLIKESSGVGANVLKNLGVDLNKVREAVERRVTPGPNEIAMGKLPQTPSAKKVVEHAIAEARGLDHNYIGTEHLLLGLLHETDGPVAEILQDLGLDPGRVRDAILNLLGAGMDAGPTPSPEETPEREEPGFRGFTERAQMMMALANQEAQRFNHEYIGTEHVLLGLIKEGSGVGANVLKNLGVDLHKARAAVEEQLTPGLEMIAMGKLPQTPRVKKVFEYANEERRSLNHQYLGTEHIMLGLVREGEGIAATVLLTLGLKLDDLRAEVVNLLGAGMPDGQIADDDSNGEEDLARESVNKLIQCPEASAFASKLLLDIATRGDRGLHDVYLTFERRIRVQYRMGQGPFPTPMDAPPAKLAPAIIAQLKQLFGMSPTIRAWAQEGRMEKVGEADLTLRATAMPTESGEIFIIHVEK
jgi:ATP-dependent Clp protease ATP-binding subunit ClpA